MFGYGFRRTLKSITSIGFKKKKKLNIIQQWSCSANKIHLKLWMSQVNILIMYQNNSTSNTDVHVHLKDAMTIDCIIIALRIE